MARIAIVAALAACSTRGPSIELALPQDEAPSIAVRGVERETPAPRVPEPLAGPHAAVIELLALDAAGHAAVTADKTGSLRLWPTLDGTREPLIVRSPLPAALALVAEPGAFSIGVADGAGEVTIERLSAAGVPEAAARVLLARPVVRLSATTHGFVALCDDSAIAIVDARGNITAMLVAEPGQRVTSLAVRGDRVLAILPADGGAVGRWVDLAGRWGARTPSLVIDPRHDVALAADARSLVGVIEGAEHDCPDCGEVDVLDIATGHVVRREPDERARVMQPLGFLDRETIAFTTPEGTRVWRDDRIVPETGGASDVGGGQLVTGFAASLTILDAKGGRHYLGYKLPALYRLVPSRDGWLASNTSQVVRLDHGFRELGQIALPERLYNVVLADAHHAFAQEVTARMRVVLVDLAHPERVMSVNAPESSNGGLFGYEPTTGVIAVGGSDQIAFAHFDAKTETFGPFATFALTASLRAVRLFDPELAGGRIATIAALGLHGEDITITDVRALYDDLALLETDEPVVQRIEVRRDDADPEAFIPTPCRIRRTSPDGARIAELDSGALALRTPAGKTVWTVAIAGASDIAWSEGGELAVAAGGIAGIDLATGQLLHPTCGWEFGLYDKPILDGVAGDLCNDAS